MLSSSVVPARHASASTDARTRVVSATAGSWETPYAMDEEHCHPVLDTGGTRSLHRPQDSAEQLTADRPHAPRAARALLHALLQEPPREPPHAGGKIQRCALSIDSSNDFRAAKGATTYNQLRDVNDCKAHVSMGKPSKQRCSSTKQDQLEDKIQASTVHERNTLEVKQQTGKTLTASFLWTRVNAPSLTFYTCLMQLQLEHSSKPHHSRHSCRCLTHASTSITTHASC